MTERKTSRRNPFLSALIFAVLYIVVSSVFYRMYHGRLYFEDFYLFNWFEFALGSITMGGCTFVVEFIRNRIG